MKRKRDDDRGKKPMENQDRGKNTLENQEILPADAFYLILLRCSAKIIGRIGCTSKEYLSTLRSRQFIKEYTNASNRRFLIRRDINQGYRVDSIKMKFSSLDDQYSEDVRADIAINESYTWMFDDISYPTQGLISVRSQSRFHICNPVTSQIVSLPEKRGENLRSFFGYDPQGDDYKILCLTVPWKISPTAIEHQIISLEDKRWKHILCEIGHYPHGRSVISVDLCIKGIIYYGAWIRVDNQDDRSVIMSFNLGSETFYAIEYPDPKCSNEDYRLTSLFSLDNKLGVVYCNQEERIVEFWVLEDIETLSWLKVDVPQNPEPDSALIWNVRGAIHTGEWVFEAPFDPGSVYFVDLQTQQRRVIRIQPYCAIYADHIDNPKVLF